jgi:hypothetical protein
VHAHLLSFEQLTHRPGPQPFLRSTFASDLWSAACIVADLYRRRRCPLFHLGGQTPIHRLVMDKAIRCWSNFDLTTWS